MHRDGEWTGHNSCCLPILQVTIAEYQRLIGREEIAHLCRLSDKDHMQRAVVHHRSTCRGNEVPTNYAIAHHSRVSRSTTEGEVTKDRCTIDDTSLAYLAIYDDTGIDDPHLVSYRSPR